MKQINKTEFIRVEKTNNYTVIHNQFLRRKDLSWKAKGILAYVLSLPDDWNITLKEVMTHATDGEGSFRSGWKELEEKGYTERFPVKDEQTKRIKYWQTVIHEISQKPHSEKPDVENPNVEKPDVENRNLLSTKDTKYLKELSTKDHSPTKVEQIPYKQIIDYLNEQTGRRYSHSANKNQDLIKARWNEGFRVKDFKQVIDVKAKDWSNDSKMNQYLRPVTLFSNKFDDYLNQGMSSQPKSRKPDKTDWDELESLVYGEGD